MDKAHHSGGRQPKIYVSPEQSAELVAEEQKALRQDFGKGEQEIWTGLALSGGGVRSATFCLGALQALNDGKILERFDYQSTASGGGFSGLSWLWFRRGHGWKFPFVEADPVNPADDTDGTAASPQPGPASNPRDTPLSFLRRNIGYLNPSSKIDYFSGAVAVLRTVLLNLLVWVPLITFLFCLIAWSELRSIAVPMGPPAPGWSIYSVFPLYGGIAVIGILVVAVAAAISVAVSLALGRLSEFVWKGDGYERTEFTKVAALVGLIILGGVILALLQLITVSGQFPFIHIATPLSPLGRVLLTAYLLAVVVIVLSIGIGRQREYQILRKLDEYASFWTPFALAFLAIGAMPLVAEMIVPKSGGPSAGLLALISLTYGIIAALYSHYMSFRNLAPGMASKVLIVSGAAVFLFGLILLCFYLAELLVPLIKSLDPAITKSVIPKRPLFGDLGWLDTHFAYEIISAAVLIAVFALFYTNVNQIGLHRYYRDRIAETFFASRDALDQGMSGPAVGGIGITIDELARDDGGRLRKPYPIVNMNAIMVDDDDTKTRLRGGANFIASPHYAGSDATGWLATPIYGGSQVGRPLHAATVAAASGAAVNSSAGYAGTGITRNRIVSVAMRLLNVRLGYWLVNPNWIARRQNSLGWTTKTVPTHFRPGLVHLLSRNWNRKAKFVELTDGGHFDNLGVYELVRRRCGIIVVCDGEADKDTSYSGFVSVARRAQEDFGASFYFEPGIGPERMVANLPLGYPSNAKAAASPYMVARISYPAAGNLPAMSGIVIYIKATMIDDVSFVTKGYKGSNPDFPHQSTVDQFFQAEQFEAYRELGYASARKCIRELDLGDLFGSPMRIWDQYLHDNRRLRGNQKQEQGRKSQ